MEKPKFSVIIPLFNKGPYVQRSINSVLNQTVQDFEIIIIEGGSEDNGKEIAETFTHIDKRIKLYLQIGKGVSGARNQGVSISNGDLIAFLDADDEWMPNYLETIIRINKNYPEAGLYATATKNEFTENVLLDLREEVKKLIPDEGLIFNYFKICKHANSIFETSSVTVPNIIFSEFGGFQENAWWGEDLDLWARIASKYPFGYSSQACCIYYFVPNCATERRELVNIHPFINSAKELLVSDEVSDEIKSDLKEYVRHLEFVTAKHDIKAGNSTPALNLLIRKNVKLDHKKRLVRIMITTKVKKCFPKFFK